MGIEAGDLAAQDPPRYGDLVRAGPVQRGELLARLEELVGLLR